MLAHPKLLKIFQSLTFLVVLSVFSFLLLVSLLQGYVFQGSLIDIDRQITNVLFAFRSVLGVQIFYVITSLASASAGIILMSFLIGILFWRKEWLSALVAFLGFVSAELVTFFLKIFFHRARPDIFLRAISEDSYSLPSGHATTAAFVFGYLGYLFFLRFSSKKKRALILFLVLVIVFLIDLSRMYLGVHYLSDVLAGNAIGFFFLFITIAIDRCLRGVRS